MILEEIKKKYKNFIFALLDNQELIKIGRSLAYIYI